MNKDKQSVAFSLFLVALLAFFMVKSSPMVYAKTLKTLETMIEQVASDQDTYQDIAKITEKKKYKPTADIFGAIKSGKDYRQLSDHYVNVIFRDGSTNTFLITPEEYQRFKVGDFILVEINQLNPQRSKVLSK